MKLARLLRWLLLLAAIAIVFVLATGGWLLRSDSGRDWLLLRVNTLLPDGATLTWDQIDGTLSGPLDIRGIHYRDGDTRFDAAHLRVDHGLWPLLSGRLDIHKLELEHGVIVLPPDEEPFELPRWPDVLPTLPMPLTVSVDELAITDLAVRRMDAPLVQIASVRSEITLGDGFVQLGRFDLDSDRGRVHLRGSYRPRERFRTQLDGQIVFPATASGVSPARAAWKAGGDIDDFRLDVDGTAPAPLALRLRLRDGEGTPHWSFTGKSEQLLLDHLGLPADVPWAFDLRANGEGGRAQVEGAIVRDALKVDILPSQIALAAGVITLDPLQLSLAQGPVRIAGTLAWEGEDPRFDLRVASSDLVLSPDTAGGLPVNARGQLLINGHWQAWTVRGDASLMRARDTATVALTGRGDSKQLQLQSLTITSPTGRLQGTGHLHWDPRLGGALQAHLAGFDPGYFFPDYPGALNGKLVANAERAATGDWSGEMQLTGLGGQLRQRAVAGDAHARWRAGRGDGAARLAIGASRLAIDGRFGDTLDLHAQFAPLDLADVFADAGGRLTGRLDIVGASAMPDYRADLQGQSLRWQDDEIASVTAQGRLAGRGRDGRLQLSARALKISGETFDRLELLLTGSLAALHAQGELSGTPGSLTLAATAARQGSAWQGKLESLRLAPERSPVWTLRAPAAYRVQAGSLRLERACLQAAAPGGEFCVQATGAQGVFSGHDLPLSLLEPFLDDPTLKHFGTVALDGRFAYAGRWGGTMTLRSARGGLRLDPQSPREVIGYSDLTLDAQLQGDRYSLQLDADLPESGTISGQLQAGLSQASAISGRLDVDIHRLDWLELFSVDLANPRGRIDGHLAIGGRVDAPVLTGQARLSAFTAELPALGVKLREGSLVLQGDAGGSTRITGQVGSGQGVLHADGVLNLADEAQPLRLTLKGDNLTAADTPNFEAVISPDLALSYGKNVLQLRGAVGVPTARVDLERLDSSLSASPDVVVLDPRDPPEVGNFLVDTDVVVRLGAQVRLKGYGLDGRLGGDLRLRDQPGRAPMANGTLEVRGTYRAYGQSLTIRQGRLSYANAAYDNPVLDIRAERVIEDITVGVRVRGSALAPETSVYSSPAMETSEALSWLMLGRPLSTASGDEAQSLSASALALGAGSNLLAQRLGTRLGLDQAGITESRALGGSVLSVGKRISPKLFLSYGISLVGTGQVITLKYLIRRGFNLSLESGTESAASLNWRKEK